MLTITKSLYVEWGELFIIIGALSLTSVIYLKNKKDTGKLFVSSEVIGFVFFQVFGVADLVIDHYLYFLPTGAEDGAPLTLGFKIEEYSDDMFLGSIISMCIVVVITFILTKIFSFADAKTIQ
ncbi:hypothetical protein [Bacillus sp. MRMR6]|uniref:hypothetical protein n=1 Tax=Bacillus sp. MRMR6 TaxID=1928617 RepID=UPI000951862F|nr:hypothetical protein [Bacillus sp. MRMR6]OLS40749.1 hypothetical protein BTR25_07600 [Bacillus sp. MRMR6]